MDPVSKKILFLRHCLEIFTATTNILSLGCVIDDYQYSDQKSKQRSKKISYEIDLSLGSLGEANFQFTVKLYIPVSWVWHIQVLVDGLSAVCSMIFALNRSVICTTGKTHYLCISIKKLVKSQSGRKPFFTL